MDKSFKRSPVYCQILFDPRSGQTRIFGPNGKDQFNLIQSSNYYESVNDRRIEVTLYVIPGQEDSMTLKVNRTDPSRWSLNFPRGGEPVPYCVVLSQDPIDDGGLIKVRCNVELDSPQAIAGDYVKPAYAIIDKQKIKI